MFLYTYVGIKNLFLFFITSGIKEWDHLNKPLLSFLSLQTNSPTIWKTLLWTTFVIYLSAFMILFYKRVREVHKLSSVSAMLIDLCSFGSLNPLTISHTPINTSHKPPGIEETSPRPDPITADTIPQKMEAYPTRPHKASNCGTSFVLYNV